MINMVPAPIDLENDKPIIYKWNLGRAAQFTTVMNNKMLIEASVDGQIGSYPVSLTITDSNPYTPLSKTYKFMIIIEASSSSNSTGGNFTSTSTNSTKSKSSKNKNNNSYIIPESA